MSAYPELGVSLVESCIGELDEATGCHPGDAPATAMPPVQAEPAAARNSRSPQTNRYSYRQAIYSRHMLNGDADIG